MTRPSFASAIHALNLTVPEYGVHPTEDEADAADALEILESEHQPVADEPDPSGHWGRCTGCAEPWPCPAWIWGEHLAVQYLGRAVDRVSTHAASIITAPPARDRRAA